MELHFYESNSSLPIGTLLGYKETERAICSKMEYIATTQMSFLSTRYIESGYRIYVHPENEEDKPYEVILGNENERTARIIRMGHNIFTLWKAGEFD